MLGALLRWIGPREEPTRARTGESVLRSCVNKECSLFIVPDSRLEAPLTCSRSWEVTGELLGRIRKARTCESDAMVSRAQLHYATLGTPPSNSRCALLRASAFRGTRKFFLEDNASVSQVHSDLIMPFVLVLPAQRH